MKNSMLLVNGKVSSQELKIQSRPKVYGKFILVNNQKFYIKGVTYGTFCPDENGLQFPAKEIIEKDFSLMAEKGINTVRTYTVPPRHLLDIADKYQLKVMVGLPWEQHISFLDSKYRIKEIIKRVEDGARECGQHPALLCFAIGNEIPASIVRWYGASKIESFLKVLYKTVKKVDPQALVTYVNFPTTEFLNLPFLDLVCFNVYLETPKKLSSYLQRLHNLSGDQPLVLAEIGLDSMRNGKEKQGEVLDWQLRVIFSKGCAGVFVFAWTDEWWRGGFKIEDWDFGIVDRQRTPKPALQSVAKAFEDVPFTIPDEELPKISVVVCSYNGSPTIRDTMNGLMKLDYPDYEVIVVNDGSKDHTAKIVKEYPVQLISTPNRGLSSARNMGMMASKGEIVAYIDDDAYPDPQWLRYLAYAFHSTPHAAIGGPNIIPEEDGFIAHCVANSPGGPVHVLIDDELAEHIPGCNMAFRKEVLLEIGGFDPVYRAAGDDVDLCWRIQHIGKTIGYHPSALVWHHRRNSVKAYWKQQKGYGKAEALLEAKWPEKYNGFGHLSWNGRIYGKGVTKPITFKKNRIFHGVWGSAAFQSVYEQAPGFISCIPLMPEWLMLISILGFFSILGIFWTPLLWLVPVLVLSLGVVFVQAGVNAYRTLEDKKFKSRFEFLRFWSLTSFLHMMQPFGRLYGRIAHGLTPWRRRGSGSFDFNLLFKKKVLLSLWSEEWKSQENWLEDIEEFLIASRTRVRRGGQYDRWDLQASCGFYSGSRGLLTIEEHGAGKQLLRFCCKSWYSTYGFVQMLLFSFLAAIAFFEHAYVVGSILTGLALILGYHYVVNTAKAIHELSLAFENLASPELTNPDEPLSILTNSSKEKNEHSNKSGSTRIINGMKVRLANRIKMELPKLENFSVDIQPEKLMAKK